MDIIENTFRFNDGKFYIDGDFWAGSNVSIVRSTIYMKEGAGILAEEGFSSSSTENQGNIIITGLGGAQWKGIAALKKSEFSIKYTTIENAGYGIIEMGDFTAETNATLYTKATIGSIENSKIVEGGGYGYYNADTVTQNIDVSVTACEFKNLQKAAIRINVAGVSRLNIGLGGPNSYDLPQGVPAFHVQGDGSPSLTWRGLGTGNFYLIDAEIITYEQDGFTLGEGAHLKFKSGRSYVYNPPPGGVPGTLNFLGTAENPVIVEGEVDAPGSWGGIYIGVVAYGYMNIQHSIIKNGGEFVLPNATEKANVSFFYNGFDQQFNRFNNCTVSGSAGYGIVVEEGSYNPEFDEPGKNNTFFDNASGDILVK